MKRIKNFQINCKYKLKIEKFKNQKTKQFKKQKT